MLLAAHERGLGGYWRTPAILRDAAGRRACEVPDDERVLGLLHLGTALGGKPVPDRAPLDEIRRYLD